MLRRYRVVIAVVLLALACAVPALADKRYSAERFDVVLDVQADGALLVTETIQFRFQGEPFTYAFRNLAYTEIDEIDRLQASMDGVVLSQGSGPGQVEVVAGRPLEVTWHFAPTSDAVHEFVLTYRVQGAIRKETGADALIWRAIPEDHDYHIERSTITLRFPSPSTLLGTAELPGAAASQESGENEVRWTVSGIAADKSLVVTARFAAGSLVTTAPQWQARQAEQRQHAAGAMVTGLAAGALTLLLALTALAVVLLREGRTGLPGYEGTSRTPPDATAPGPAVRLAGGGTPTLATLFDLAGRGLLRIEETGRGLLGGKHYGLEYLPGETALRPHEQALLQTLFQEHGQSDETSLPLSTAASRLSGNAGGYQEALEMEMQAAGWVDPRRKTIRSGLLAVAFAALVLGAIILVPGLVLAAANAAQGGISLSLGAVAAGVGGALLLAGLVAIIAGSALSPLSEQGERAAAAWKSFGTYLRDVARGREAGSGQDLFERYLPLAAGFGLGESWARHFREQGLAGTPNWFGALDATADDFGAVVAVMAAVNSSVSSADAGAAAAAGASGGGGSGAG